MARRIRSEVSSLSRRAPSRELRQRFLIVCEGVSEVHYFDTLMDRVRPSTLCVRTVRAKSSDPALIVKETIERVDRDQWDQAWCVFDIEAPVKATAAPAIEEARKAKLRVAWSNPCFEVWVLFHFVDSVQPALFSVDVATEVKRHLPRYTKTSFVTDSMLSSVGSAVKRAERIAERHMRNLVASPRDNPNTLVGQLVNEILAHSH